MLENHWRHLPVLDDSGAVVALLDVAKVLNDAISKLEKSVDKSSSAAEDVVQQVVGKQGAGGAQAAALQALLSQVMATAFGNQTSPTLGSVLAGKPASTVVSPSTSIREAALVMAEHRNPALIVDDGELVGICSFKDILNRAVSKCLDLDSTPISAIHTPNPDCALHTTTVLEALQTLHDNKFLSLPVTDDSGQVLGVVGVVELMLNCGGADGWRSVFSNTMQLDDCSDSASAISQDSMPRSMVTSTSMKKKNQTKEEGRPVSKLRPKKPLLSECGDSILATCQQMSSKRQDATIVVHDGSLAVSL